MAYMIKQIRYYGEGHKLNYPKGLRADHLISGTAFQPYMPIIQLGIQYKKDAPIRFYLNGSKDPILSHPYGLYELDLTGRSQILSLKFEPEDLTVGNVNEDSPLIVDLVYVG